jgi:hypothetical protein
MPKKNSNSGTSRRGLTAGFHRSDDKYFGNYYADEWLASDAVVADPDLLSMSLPVPAESGSLFDQPE